MWWLIEAVVSGSNPTSLTVKKTLRRGRVTVYILINIGPERETPPPEAQKNIFSSFWTIYFLGKSKPRQLGRGWARINYNAARNISKMFLFLQMFSYPLLFSLNTPFNCTFSGWCLHTVWIVEQLYCRHLYLAALRSSYRPLMDLANVLLFVR